MWPQSGETALMGRAFGENAMPKMPNFRQCPFLLFNHYSPPAVEKF